ncbi:SanA/YdcF family protein [Virgisporangium aliadipatigenens]|uniref:SanA/YdcF family protein n=1 Tax=Virgisporangium aliadipatigenens TaxID=741659 RepID=UPI001944E269|nr:ElyC/SanA/YdcF family protein [Virgisporangium aliadipatigenens]
MRARLFRLLRLALWCASALAIGTVGSVAWVRTAAHGYVYDEADVPAAPVALVLGAEVYDNGSPSAFLAARLDIARRLYLAGKVRAILVSGDHGRWEYDEPGASLNWLTARGVPITKVVLDYAGFDTYDSCVRATKIFGVDRAIVVTQSYHIARAVTVCRRVGVDAVGVGDSTVKHFRVDWAQSGNREHGACVKAVLDVVSGRDPVFLGDHETGVEEALRA